jgi:quinolinate synthase
MEKLNPEKIFIPVPPIDSTCGCNDCKYMRLNTLQKIYNCLLTEQPEILVNEEMRQKAVKPIEKMLELSK